MSYQPINIAKTIEKEILYGPCVIFMNDSTQYNRKNKLDLYLRLRLDNFETNIDPIKFNEAKDQLGDKLMKMEVENIELRKFKKDVKLGFICGIAVTLLLSMLKK